MGAGVEGPAKAEAGSREPFEEKLGRSRRSPEARRLWGGGAGADRALEDGEGSQPGRSAAGGQRRAARGVALGGLGWGLTRKGRGLADRGRGLEGGGGTWMAGVWPEGGQGRGGQLPGAGSGWPGGGAGRGGAGQAAAWRRAGCVGNAEVRSPHWARQEAEAAAEAAAGAVTRTKADCGFTGARGGRRRGGGGGARRGPPRARRRR